MHSRHTASRNRQLRAEMARHGISIAPTPWQRLFVAAPEASSPVRTLAFVPVPIERVRSRRSAS